ncbi:MAG TPA: magnesium/cobalt transporter CorA [Pyrinomonadaceae bacterium]
MPEHKFAEIFVYREGAEKVEEGFAVNEIASLIADPKNVVWVDLRGEDDADHDAIKDLLLNTFKFHYLTVEDCLETRNIPKIEAFADYLYFIVHGVKPDEKAPAKFQTRELDGYLGRNYVVTFHVERFRSIKNVKQQVRSSPFACQRGAAYLLHQILDNVVDNYMPLVDQLDVAINELEECVLSTRHNDGRLLGDIMDLRRSVARLRRTSTRQLEVLYRMSHGEFPLIPENVLPFFRDVHDHLRRIADLAESYRDLVAGLFEIHFTVIATKTNDIMKTLAVVSTIILPLTLIAGIYGMNFEYMPELHTQYGYFATLAAMAILTIALLFYFWRRGWIYNRDAVVEVEPEVQKDEEVAVERER